MFGYSYRHAVHAILNYIYGIGTNINCDYLLSNTVSLRGLTRRQRSVTVCVARKETDVVSDVILGVKKKRKIFGVESSLERGGGDEGRDH